MTLSLSSGQIIAYFVNEYGVQLLEDRKDLSDVVIWLLLHHLERSKGLEFRGSCNFRGEEKRYSTSMSIYMALRNRTEA
jgi:hypothetical protein